jgi:hypothetical protein
MSQRELISTTNKSYNGVSIGYNPLYNLFFNDEIESNISKKKKGLILNNEKYIKYLDKLEIFDMKEKDIFEKLDYLRDEMNVAILEKKMIKLTLLSERMDQLRLNSNSNSNSFGNSSIEGPKLIKDKDSEE